jgi:hypothetical protein
VGFSMENKEIECEKNGDHAVENPKQGSPNILT